MHSVPDPPSLEELTRWMEPTGIADVSTLARDIRFLISTIKGMALVARLD